MNTSTFILKLQQQLAQYGLNPIDWEIVADSDGSYRLKNDDLEMRGTVCHEMESWLELQLMH